MDIKARGGLVLYFDGCCRNNGAANASAAYGWLLKRAGETLAQGNGPVGNGPGATNNVAEYHALVNALDALAVMDLGEPVEVCGDSLLVIQQMTGAWGCWAEHLIPLHQRAGELADQVGVTAWTWIPRDQNAEADRLAHRVFEVAPDGQ